MLVFMILIGPVFIKIEQRIISIHQTFYANNLTRSDIQYLSHTQHEGVIVILQICFSLHVNFGILAYMNVNRTDI